MNIDAFEWEQTCVWDQHEYRGGVDATFALLNIIRRRIRDHYGRPLVRCRIGDLDLGREMVRLGWAVAEYGHEYDQDQADARNAKAGVWAGTFDLPKDWRKAQRVVDPTWPPR